MHKLIVEEKSWLDEKQYLNALGFCMLLPGPEAMQIATYSGWRMHGVVGGLIAGLLFVIPGAIVMLALAMLYTAFGKLALVDALFMGIKAAVVVVVIEALLRVSRKALLESVHWVIALLSFVGIFFLNLSFPLIVLIAALFGFWRSQDVKSSSTAILPPNKISSTINTVLIWVAVWIAPFIMLAVFFENAFLTDIGVFFSRLAVVTFGGAYAVLAYMAQDVVASYGWLTADEMIDGLGLAETTPGPLILVTEFVGYVAGYREGGMLLGLLAALFTLWVTFVPCFLWIFAGAPYIDWIGDQPRLKGALSAITASVVGVILNLSVWFSLHVIFASVTQNQIGVLSLWTPDWSSFEPLAFALIVLCAVAIFKLRWGIVFVMTLSSIIALATTINSTTLNALFYP